MTVGSTESSLRLILKCSPQPLSEIPVHQKLASVICVAVLFYRSLLVQLKWTEHSRFVTFNTHQLVSVCYESIETNSLDELYMSGVCVHIYICMKDAPSVCFPFIVAKNSKFTISLIFKNVSE